LRWLILDYQRADGNESGWDSQSPGAQMTELSSAVYPMFIFVSFYMQADFQKNKH